MVFLKRVYIVISDFLTIEIIAVWLTAIFMNNKAKPSLVPLKTKNQKQRALLKTKSIVKNLA